MEIVCEGYKKSMRKDSDNAKLLEPGEIPSKRKVLVVEDNELNRDISSLLFWKRNLMFFSQKTGKKDWNFFPSITENYQ